MDEGMFGSRKIFFKPLYIIRALYVYTYIITPVFTFLLFFYLGENCPSLVSKSNRSICIARL